MAATQVNKITLVFPFNVPGITNRVTLSTTMHTRDATLSFALPFLLAFTTKPPNNSYPYAVKVKKSNDMFVYILKFEPIDLKRFIVNCELHVVKEMADEYEEITREMDERMEEYERTEKMGKKKKIVDDDGWIRYE
ncbi:hypothetical protein THOM_1526 [Trachipleistophora hominis]|uniref:Uncharacterized protein n=1 Tax=Trachipleistophora hominis TaxID=72359 RepID=L7JXK3_TRAHO|nr:hypothetical protein THOM_1526 [Trachipleistophora hominis]